MLCEQRRRARGKLGSYILAIVACRSRRLFLNAGVVNTLTPVVQGPLGMVIDLARSICQTAAAQVHEECNDAARCSQASCAGSLSTTDRRRRRWLRGINPMPRQSTNGWSQY